MLSALGYYSTVRDDTISDDLDLLDILNKDEGLALSLPLGDRRVQNWRHAPAPGGPPAHVRFSDGGSASCAHTSLQVSSQQPCSSQFESPHNEALKAILRALQGKLAEIPSPNDARNSVPTPGNGHSAGPTAPRRAAEKAVAQAVAASAHVSAAAAGPTAPRAQRACSAGRLPPNGCSCRGRPRAAGPCSRCVRNAAAAVSAAAAAGTAWPSPPPPAAARPGHARQAGAAPSLLEGFCGPGTGARPTVPGGGCGAVGVSAAAGLAGGEVAGCPDPHGGLSRGALLSKLKEAEAQVAALRRSEALARQRCEYLAEGLRAGRCDRGAATRQAEAARRLTAQHEEERRGLQRRVENLSAFLRKEKETREAVERDLATEKQRCGALGVQLEGAQQQLKHMQDLLDEARQQYRHFLDVNKQAVDRASRLQDRLRRSGAALAAARQEAAAAGRARQQAGEVAAGLRQLLEEMYVGRAAGQLGQALQEQLEPLVRQCQAAAAAAAATTAHAPIARHRKSTTTVDQGIQAAATSTRPNAASGGSADDPTAAAASVPNERRASGTLHPPHPTDQTRMGQQGAVHQGPSTSEPRPLAGTPSLPASAGAGGPGGSGKSAVVQLGPGPPPSGPQSVPVTVADQLQHWMTAVADAATQPEPAGGAGEGRLRAPQSQGHAAGPPGLTAAVAALLAAAAEGSGRVEGVGRGTAAHSPGVKGRRKPPQSERMLEESPTGCAGAVRGREVMTEVTDTPPLFRRLHKRLQERALLVGGEDGGPRRGAAPDPILAQIVSSSSTPYPSSSFGGGAGDRRDQDDDAHADGLSDFTNGLDRLVRRRLSAPGCCSPAASSLISISGVSPGDDIAVSLTYDGVEDTPHQSLRPARGALGAPRPAARRGAGKPPAPPPADHGRPRRGDLGGGAPRRLAGAGIRTSSAVPPAIRAAWGAGAPDGGRKLAPAKPSQSSTSISASYDNRKGAFGKGASTGGKCSNSNMEAAMAQEELAVRLLGRAVAAHNNRRGAQTNTLNIAPAAAASALPNVSSPAPTTSTLLHSAVSTRHRSVTTGKHAGDRCGPVSRAGAPLRTGSPARAAAAAAGTAACLARRLRRAGARAASMGVRLRSERQRAQASLDALAQRLSEQGVGGEGKDQGPRLEPGADMVGLGRRNSGGGAAADSRRVSAEYDDPDGSSEDGNDGSHSDNDSDGSVAPVQAAMGGVPGAAARRRRRRPRLRLQGAALTAAGETRPASLVAGAAAGGRRGPPALATHPHPMGYPYSHLGPSNSCPDGDSCPPSVAPSEAPSLSVVMTARLAAAAAAQKRQQSAGPASGPTSPTSPGVVIVMRTGGAPRGRRVEYGAWSEDTSTTCPAVAEGCGRAAGAHGHDDQGRGLGSDSEDSDLDVSAAKTRRGGGSGGGGGGGGGGGSGPRWAPTACPPDWLRAAFMQDACSPQPTPSSSQMGLQPLPEERGGGQQQWAQHHQACSLGVAGAQEAQARADERRHAVGARGSNKGGCVGSGDVGVNGASSESDDTDEGAADDSKGRYHDGAAECCGGDAVRVSTGALHADDDIINSEGGEEGDVTEHEEEEQQEQQEQEQQEQEQEEAGGAHYASSNGDHTSDTDSDYGCQGYGGASYDGPHEHRHGSSDSEDSEDDERTERDIANSPAPSSLTTASTRAPFTTTTGPPGNMAAPAPVAAPKMVPAAARNAPSSRAPNSNMTTSGGSADIRPLMPVSNRHRALHPQTSFSSAAGGGAVATYTPGPDAAAAPPGKSTGAKPLSANGVRAPSQTTAATGTSTSSTGTGSVSGRVAVRGPNGSSQVRPPPPPLPPPPPIDIRVNDSARQQSPRWHQVMSPGSPTPPRRRCSSGVSGEWGQGGVTPRVSAGSPVAAASSGGRGVGARRAAGGNASRLAAGRGRNSGAAGDGGRGLTEGLRASYQAIKRQQLT